MTDTLTRPPVARSTALSREEIDSRAPGWGALPARARLRTDAPVIPLDGAWAFRLSSGPLEAPDDGWHLPGADLPDSSWGTVHVPGHWVLQGFGSPAYTNIQYPFPLDPPHLPAENPVGDYRTVFERVQVPDGGRALLRVDGIESAATIWLNGVLLGTTRGSRLTHEFDITDALEPAANTLALRVAQFSAASYLEGQDMWWLPGIFRSVAVLVRPAAAIDDVAVRADYDSDAGTAELEVDVVARGAVDIRLVEPDVAVPAGTALRVPGVEPWTAEEPRLYTLVVSTSDETVTVPVGFRRVHVDGARLLVNGAPVTLRGVNRHEHHPERGRAVSLDEARAELELMKRSNINAIRTAHYPPHPDFLALTDELGFYVILENDLETHGFELADWDGNPSDDPAWRDAFLDRITRTVHRDRNHASVIMWSLGNEAGTGANLEASASRAREIDPTRLIHYEGDWTSRYVDVYSRMYASVDEVDDIGRERDSAPREDATDAERRRRQLPFLLCEYAHAMGNGPGGLLEYQQVIDRHPRIAGGFIWEWVEQGIAVRDDAGRRVMRYGGDFGEPVHDGSFVIDGLVSADREPRPSLADVAAVYAPVRLSVSEEAVTIESRLDHATTDAFRFVWTLDADGAELSAGELDVPALAPRATVTVALPCRRPIRGTVVSTVRAVLASATPWADAGHVVATGQHVADRPRTVRTVAAAGATGRTIAIGPARIDAARGALVAIGDLEVASCAVGLWRAPTDNDLAAGWDERELPPMADRWAAGGVDRMMSRMIDHRFDGDTLQMRSRVAPAGLAHGVDAQWRWSATSAGGAQLELELRPFGPWPCDWARAGVDLTLAGMPEGMEIYGLGPQPAYPDTGQGAWLGRHRIAAADLVTPHVRPQESGARRDVREARIAITGGRALHLDAWTSPVALTVSPYSRQAVAAASHLDDLVPDGMTHISIDAAQSGVGTATCGPGVLPWYRVPARRALLRVEFGAPREDDRLR